MDKGVVAEASPGVTGMAKHNLAWSMRPSPQRHGQAEKKLGLVHAERNLVWFVSPPFTRWARRKNTNWAMRQLPLVMDTAKKKKMVHAAVAPRHGYAEET
jgi:hypothetical protein